VLISGLQGDRRPAGDIVAAVSYHYFLPGPCQLQGVTAHGRYQSILPAERRHMCVNDLTIGSPRNSENGRGSKRRPVDH